VTDDRRAGTDPTTSASEPSICARDASWAHRADKWFSSRVARRIADALDEDLRDSDLD